MTADEARELSKKGRENSIKEEYDKIMKFIKKETGYGGTEIVVSDRLYEENVIRLKKDNFEVTYKRFVDGGVTIVSWG